MEVDDGFLQASFCVCDFLFDSTFAEVTMGIDAPRALKQLKAEDLEMAQKHKNESTIL